MTIKEKAWCKIPLDKLVSASWNYKEDDEKKAKKLKENLKRNGQIENIIVRKLETGFFEVVNGNHRLSVFEEAGIFSPVCFNLGEITDSKAKRIAIETNETRFETNTFKLAELINELVDDGGWLVQELEQTMPFDKSEFDELRELYQPDFDFSQFGEGSNRGVKEEDDTDVIVCPNCGHKFSMREVEDEKGKV